MEIRQFLVLVGHGHACEVLPVPDSLEVATYQEQVDFIVVLSFEFGYLGVDSVEFPMTAAFYRNLELTIRIQCNALDI